MSKQGSFTISLDFELFWGVRAGRELESYKENLLGVQEAIPEILALFKQYNIHATWATVGFLFFKNIEEIVAHKPKVLPLYHNTKVDPYVYLESLETAKKDEEFLKMHVASRLIEQIKNTANQELATHTFSHFFPYESCENTEAFSSDMKQAIEQGKKEGLSLTSLVFPRNQMKAESIEVLKSLNIQSYRGNPTHWAYCDGDNGSKSLYQRIYRLIDTYVNLSGHHSSIPLYDNELIELKGSMFLRPYLARLSFLEGLKVRRIKKAMSDAARHGKNFHLWWHPHNFGLNQENNLKNLKEILEHFEKLNSEYQMLSLTMKEVTNHVRNKK